MQVIPVDKVIPESQKIMKTYYVYIMTNKNNNVLYTGITNNLKRRVYEHKNQLIDGFTRKYNCKKLVWYEESNNVLSAIGTEKRMKKWKREFKINIISKKNPNWEDLSEGLL